MNDPTIRRVLAAFLLISAVLIFVAVIAMRNLSRDTASADWVNHTHAVMLEIEDISANVRAGEGALRAYAATGEARDRDACREAFGEMAEHLEIAKALTRNEPAQYQEILQLEKLTKARADFARAVFAARTANQPAALRDLLAGTSAGNTGEIRRLATRLRDEELGLLTERDRASFLQAHTTRWTVWSGVAINFLLLAGAAWLIRDDIAARRRAAAILQQANEQLEYKVRERTLQLASANEELSNENLERRWTNEALEHQIRYNELIVDSIGDSVFVLTKALNISRINPAVVHLTGFDAPHLVNRPLESIVRLTGTGGSEAGLFNPLAQSLKEGRDLQNLPAEVETKLGQKRPVRLALYPLRDGHKVVGGVVILHAASPIAATAA